MLNLRKQFKRLIIISYAVIMFYIVFSGVITKFVNPRVTPYIITCAVILLVFFVVDIVNKKTDSIQFSKSDIIYIFPILLIFFINNGEISSNLISNKGINIGKTSTENTQTSDYEDAMKLAEQMDNAELAKKTVVNENKEVKNIEINNSNYVSILMDISDNLDNYVGDEISIDGFIYRDSTMKSTEFVIGRLYISCCTADAQLLGYLCNYTDSSNIKDNEWYNVKAKIDTTIQDGMKLPYFKVEKVTKINKPENEYVN
ncbi:MAG: TIGR03943 family protein [Bacilli bacterium]|nr:TIGR03943 family protein [Bacilli bacterium]